MVQEEPNTPPLISVIIPAYNAAEFVVGAIESALAQTYEPIEVIVVDDGSTDDTAEVLAPLADDIRYVQQENRGLAGARNRGIIESQGELVAFLDADDKWMPEKLARQWRWLTEHPEAGLVHSDLMFWRPETGEVFYEARPRAKYAGDCYTRLFFESWVTPSTVLVRRACLERAGMFDERFRWVEDVDLWLRIARHYPFAYIDEPLVLYRLHGASLTRNDLRMREGELAALEKALAADPELETRIGRGPVRRKLHELCFGIGYHYYDQNDLRAARAYFAKAWRLRPTRAYAAALGLATLLPARVVNGARRMKRSFSAPAAASLRGGEPHTQPAEPPR